MKRIFETIDPWKIVQTSLDNADNLSLIHI